MQTLSLRALNRALLARQHLLRRSEMTPVEMIEHLVGMQAQAPLPPYYGLWTRLQNFRPSDLADLIVARKIVRIALMRSTIHLVSANDCLPLRRNVQIVLERAFRGGYGRHLTQIDWDELAAEGRRLVEEEPLTFGELGSLLQIKYPGVMSEALSGAVRAAVPLVQVPPRGIWGKGGAAAHTSAETWLKRKRGAALSLEQMLIRYLRAFGPASVRDMQQWSGLTRLNEVVAKMEKKLIKFHDKNGVTLYDLPEAPRPGEDVEASVRLLPEWDNVLISFANRSRIIDEKHRQRVYTVNGIIPGTVLLDGFVAGAWRIEKNGKKPNIGVEFFRRVSKSERAAVEEEVDALREFMLQ